MWPFANREEGRLQLPDNGSSPGIQLYSSSDLKAWKPESWLVKSSELPENSPHKHRFWAPEIHKFGGKFYLIFTADNWLGPEHNPAGSSSTCARRGAPTGLAGTMSRHHQSARRQLL